jgi:signal transduction histidine kinase
VVASIRSALRLPYAALIVDNRLVAEDGTPPDADALLAAAPHTVESRAVVPLDLEYGGQVVGSLEVGVRSGESVCRRRTAMCSRWSPYRLPSPCTRPSVERTAVIPRELVSAREEERRRIRRDLHDGLGPTLTGVAFTADAAANLVATDPARAHELLATLRADTRTAISDVRRLVDDLRPPALDELGLVGALRTARGPAVLPCRRGVHPGGGVG